MLLLIIILFLIIINPFLIIIILFGFNGATEIGDGATEIGGGVFRVVLGFQSSYPPQVSKKLASRLALLPNQLRSIVTH